MGPVSSRVSALAARARREVDEGVLPSCQFALAYQGELVDFQTFGEAADSTRYVVWSISKGVFGGAVWKLLSTGELDPVAPVVRYLPDFGTNGKEAITIEQLLQHTAGIPLAPMWAPDWATSEGRRGRFARWRLNWEPGSRYEYHALSAHWVLAEVVETLSGVDYRQFLAKEVLDPLGLDRLALGVPEDEQAGIAEGVLVGEQPPDEDYVAAGLVPPLTPAGLVDPFALSLNDPGVRAVGIPAGGVIATAADLALYYQALLHNPGGLWSDEVLADVTGTVRNTFPDPGQGGIPANRTRGLVVAGGDGNGWRRVNFGRTVSARTFGHDGAFGQIAWADPGSGLSFAYLTNGLDRNGVRLARRGADLSGAAGLCTEP